MKIFILFALLFFFISLRLFIKVKVFFNLLSNYGEISIYLYSIPIVWIKFKLNLGYVYLLFKKKKFKLKFDIDKKAIRYANILKSYLFQIVYISKIGVNTYVSSCNNNFIANLNSNIILLEYIIFNVIKHNNKEIIINFKNNIGFKPDEFLIKITLNFFVSFIDVLLSIFKAVLARRYIYEGE